MDNQNPTTSNQIPPTGNIPAQNPPVQETPPSQVHTAPQPTSPPSPKFFLSNKIILLIVILLILLGAGGIYLSTGTKPKPTSTLTPSPTSKPTPTPDPTASWKILSSSECNFEIKYPLELEPVLFTGSKTPSLKSKNIDNSSTEPLVYIYGFSCIDNPDQSTVENWIKEFYAPEVLSSVRMKNLTANGIQWTEVIGLPSRNGDIEYFSARESKIYSVIFFPYNESQPFERQLEFKKIFDQILSTFRFDSP